ncbi:Protein CBG16773 [Caenorhabditis briggsae]|uniref:Protein CBG16773 n=1 Tax=Caenorhabditis briggsae TaxID=6238 RepID=A8XPS6_CAEBR|nr:Protein CBG16773 [Caenorhabditis briggsae]CAP34652.2 Protein CBG16773 [Caenorhabditis briggsae]
MDTYNPFNRDVFEMARAKNWPAPINYVEVSEVPVLLRDKIRFKNNSKKILDFRLIFRSPEGAREITVSNPEGITSEKEFDFRIYVTSDMIHETACKVMKWVHYNMYIAAKEYDDAYNFVAYHEKLITSIVFRDAQEEYEMEIATPSESQQPGPSQLDQPNPGIISARKSNAAGNGEGSENSKKRAMDCDRKLMKGDGYYKWRNKNIFYKAMAGGLFDVKWTDDNREEKGCITCSELSSVIGKAKKEIVEQIRAYKPRGVENTLEFSHFFFETCPHLECVEWRFLLVKLEI